MRLKTNNSALKYDTPYSSNNIRLSGGQWLLTVFCVVILLTGLPRIFNENSRFAASVDFRLPSASSDDYWLFSQWCKWACRNYDVLVLGDSAIRGYYVDPNETFSHDLSQCVDGLKFANLGMDGMHPAAMTGLLRYYGRPIQGRCVIVQMNPLWMSSAGRDLQGEKEQQFHHQKLVPQFGDRIKCYRASRSKRISAVLERYIGPMSWADHLRIEYFGGGNMDAWTLQHPYELPRAADADNGVPQEQRRPWTDMGVTKQDMPFVNPDESIQWSFFKQVVELLESRGNHVFVIIGPFNEYMLEGQSVQKYAEIKKAAADWLESRGTSHLVMDIPPVDMFRDASHPLAPGYEAMAHQLADSRVFREFLSNGHQAVGAPDETEVSTASILP